MNHYTPIEYRIAVIIADNPGIFGVGIWNRYIATVGSVAVGTIYTTLSRMVKDGFVKRRTDTEDHRQGSFVMTPAGLSQLTESAEHYNRLAELGKKYTNV